MRFQEARNLANLFPDRYRLQARLSQTGNPKSFWWLLEELTDFSPKWKRVGGTWSVTGVSNDAFHGVGHWYFPDEPAPSEEK